jgi:hypothetical protein
MRRRADTKRIQRHDLRVPDAIVRRLRFERGTGQLTDLKPSPDGALDGRSLQRIRRLTADSAALLDGVRDMEPDIPAGRWGKRLTKPEQDEVERRAMEVVREDYEERAWAVKDVHRHRPYDLECQKGHQEHHVELKGLTGPPIAVEVTRGEVTHARTCSHRAVLAVVSQIKLRRGRSPIATGGSLRIDEPWRITREALEPLRYKYMLPRS